MDVNSLLTEIWLLLYLMGNNLCLLTARRFLLKREYACFGGERGVGQNELTNLHVV